MELINLKSDEARHIVLWLSPEGRIFSLSLSAEEIEATLFRQLSSGMINLDFLTTIAEMICKKNSIVSDSTKDYLLNHGWIHYCRVYDSWIWYGKSINRRQSSIARQIDNNESLQLLITRLS